MQVTFYSFSKKVNSTKRPSAVGETLNAVYLKDMTDINKPVITVSKNVSNMNYAKIDDAYFFISAVESMTNNIWRVTLVKDLLSTYKDEILATTAYVSRASNNYNKYIIDEFNTPLTRIKRTVLQGNGATGFYETGDGCYILEVINSLTGTVNSGFNAAYILTAEQMQHISNYLMTNQGIIEELSKIFRAPIEAVVSCKWLPINYNLACQQTGALVSNVYLGAVDIPDMTAYIVGLNGMEFYDDFDLSPYLSKDYVANPRFTEISMCLPYVGTVSIDTKQIAESIGTNKILRVRVALDVRSGKQLVMIVPQENPNVPINTYETVICEDRPIGSASQNFAPVLYSSAAAIPVMGMGKGWFAGSLASIATSLVESQRTMYSTVGTSGGSAFEFFGVANRCIIVEREKSYEVEDSNIKNTIGLPLNKAVILSSLGSGFVQTINASVNMIALYDEYNAVNSLLNGGIYIE